ncbi:MAG: helix-turn-helix transcriptional regulator [Bacteroidales bacterium]|nr:helix-turn-helix transcriptional regulator [Bacteroidales bacterium]
MAARLGMDRNAYRNIEVGKTAIVHEKLDAIADILGVSAESLLLGFNPLDLDSDPRLEDFKKEYSLRSEEAQEGSKKEITRLKAEIYDLKEKVSLLQQSLEDKAEIIKFLKNKKK